MPRDVFIYLIVVVFTGNIIRDNLDSLLIQHKYAILNFNRNNHVDAVLNSPDDDYLI